MATPPARAALNPPRSRRALFLGFLKLGAISFGGVGPMARHTIIVDRRWMDERDYAETLGLCQAAPGANICNLAIMVGDRFFGASGALAALTGLLAAPLLVIAGLIAIYDQIAVSATVQAALTGAVAAAAGLTIAAAIRLLVSLGATPRIVVVAILAFALVGVLRISLIVVVVILGAFSYVWLCWSERP